MNLKIWGIVIVGALLCQAAPAQEIATSVCAPEHGVFSVTYVPDSDEGQNSLAEFPIRCRLGRANYEVTAERGKFSEHRCGEHPIVSLTLKRNNSVLIGHMTFGENCFRGASLRKFETIEKRGKLVALKFCALAQDGDSDSKCRTLEKDELDALDSAPIQLN
ncbi:MAG: hypothetical protein ACJ8GW_06215 [Massilia sp.]